MNNAKYNLCQWLDRLENRYQQEIQLGLERIKKVAERLGLLQPEATVITVAGTNGKGSTVATLEAIYCVAGYRVGTYTSPHLVDFNERIRINQMPINDETLVDIFTEIEKSRADIPLTYFEVATLAALLYFKTVPLDLIILEVGLGGRLDATNIIDADLAIITTIDFDHQEWLGDTLDKIAAEKLGILRPKQLAIIAAEKRPALIDERLNALKCRYWRNGQEYSYHINNQSLSILLNDFNLQLPVTSLHADSVSAAVVASQILREKLPVNTAVYTKALPKIVLKGRLQQVEIGNHTLLVDVAHNPQSARHLADYIAKLSVQGKIHVIFSALNDKDLTGMIEPLAKKTDYWYPVQLSSKRASNREKIIRALEQNCCPIIAYYNAPACAYESACLAAEDNDLIVVFGSFILVGAVLSLLPNSILMRSYNEISF